jgi:recombination protein RecA
MSSAKALAATINKETKQSNLVINAREIKTELKTRTPTGTLALDYVLGGGWPDNKWSEIVGDESSGKTGCILKTIEEAQYQNPDHTTLWIAGEPFDEVYAEMCGVDLDRLWIADTNIQETAFDIVLKYLDSRSVDLVVIDSLPALTTLEEDGKDMDGFSIASAARNNGQFFRKAKSGMKRSLVDAERSVAGIVVNQWREKVGVMYGDNRTTPGGRQKNYEFVARIEVKRGEWIYDDVLRDYSTGEAKKIQVGQEMRFTAFKNKSAIPYRRGVVDFYFQDATVKGAEKEAGSYDTLKTTIALGRQLGVITNAGKWFSFMDKQWDGVKNLVTEVERDPDLCSKIDDQISQAITRTAQINSNIKSV